MVHFSCDLCGKMILPGDDQRYVVRIETYAAPDPPLITDADLEDDHLEEISQLLHSVEDDLDTEIADESRTAFSFDLCPDCHKRYVRDPLGKEHSYKPFFSKN